MNEAEKNEVRGRLIAAATDVIAEGSHTSMPLRSVAQRAGTTTGAIQHHFGNRDGLLLAVLGHHGRRTAERLRARRTSDPPPPPHVARVILLEFLPLDDERREEALVAYAFEGLAIGDRAMAEAYRQQHTQLGNLLAEHLPQMGTADIELLLAALGGIRTDMLLHRISNEQALTLLDHLIARLSQNQG
ncbi:MAG: TetR/AcrR family transcriptional regulator [Brevibacterium sp.]